MGTTRRRVHAGARGLSTALQPIVDLTTGRVVGVESLARFADHRPPEAHFAEAATAGRRLDLELAAVRAGLSRLGELPQSAYLTLNVSPDVATSSELAIILEAAPADRLIIELTEHAPVGDYEVLTRALSTMRARGMRVAIDDAGAGFASLRHVLALRPDVIKLDISITKGINADPRRKELVRALVTFSRATGCTLIAEGIETTEELAAVRALGVGCGQGFCLGRPERGAAGPWQVSLPRLPRAAQRPGARSFRPSGRLGRIARPAGVLLAAAIAWPGIVAAAGLKSPTVPVPARTARTEESRREYGGSNVRTPIGTTKPAAALPTVTSAVRSVVPAPAVASAPAVSASPSARPLPVKDTVATVGRVVGDLTQTVDSTVENTAETLGESVETVSNLLGGLLGRNR